MKQLFSLFLALVASVGTLFANVEIGYLEYNLNDENNTAEVVGLTYYASVTDLVIPPSINYGGKEYSVKSISGNAFTSNHFQTVELPNTLEIIGYNAFWDSQQLTEITIPISVVKIEHSAFEICNSLTRVIWNSKHCADFNTSGSYHIFHETTNITSMIFGDEVEYIPKELCSQMVQLTAVTIPESVSSIGYKAFEGSGISTPLYNSRIFFWLPSSYIGAYTIPNGIETIAENAFSGCTSLTSVTISNSVTSIGSSAFSGCTSLTSVTIPNSVTSIGSSAFSSCTSLSGIAIPNSVTSIGSSVFSRCTSLSGIAIPNSVTSIGTGAFNYCTSLTNLSIINKNIQIESNGYGMFIQSTALKHISAPACIFDLHSDYTSYPSYFPQKLDSIEVTNGELSENALWLINLSRKTLKHIDLSGTTHADLADEAFKEFYNLQTLILPSNLTHIGYKSIAECVKLKSIDIPASVEEIDDRAFEDCRSIETITFGGVLPSSAPGRSFASKSSTSQLHRIGNWAFYNAHELQHLEIPEGVTEIGDGAFYGCVYLEDLVLPSTVRSIGDNCFALCSKLTMIVLSSPEPPTIFPKTFYDVERQIPVYVPDDCINAYEDDEIWGEFDIQGVSNMPSALANTSADATRTGKVIRNGQLFILRDGKTYTIQGQEVK